jgi:hypothetical protein
MLTRWNDTHGCQIADYQRTKLALRLEDVLAERAKANQANSTGGQHPQLLTNLSKAESINTRAEIAKAAGHR